MKVQPEANNAIVIELDDDTEIRMHNSFHGDVDYLFLTNLGGLRVEVAENRLDWKTVATESMIRISVVRGTEKK